MNTFQVMQLVLSIIAAGSQGIGQIIAAAHTRGEISQSERDQLIALADKAFSSRQWQTDEQLAQQTENSQSPPTTSGEPGSGS